MVAILTERLLLLAEPFHHFTCGIGGTADDGTGNGARGDADAAGHRTGHFAVAEDATSAIGLLASKIALLGTAP
ncbi:Uncharacterised protein [Serratia proteamaculans]|nr:Uncharacterised protein [Serratia proteamaculans]CAI0817953.1 Uncharacterised protein [Serratia proteamaculans]CAI0819448.1 Uncharacterised protein [Serratia proteamaculans]CAI2067926.1 Uncharacterised protein [Serratia proteamaculans]CAI2423159.1 Uncharacterised protein [Serratia proteamaculans]